MPDDLFNFEQMRLRAGMLNPLEKSEKAYHDNATEYFREQRALIAKQSRNATITMWSAIIMAIATLIIALFSYLQWNQSSKMAEQYERLNTPQLKSQ